jgi:hypothetical protein
VRWVGGWVGGWVVCVCRGGTHRAGVEADDDAVRLEALDPAGGGLADQLHPVPLAAAGRGRRAVGMRAIRTAAAAQGGSEARNSRRNGL